MAVFLITGTQKIFANITDLVSNDKEEQFVSVENSPLSIVGLVTEINNNSIIVYARDNSLYNVDLSNAKIVSGYIGYYAKPSSFSEIKITDYVTVVFENEPYNSKIVAREVAYRRTPETIIKRQKDLAKLFNVEFSTSTENLLNKENELLNEQNVENSTSTLVSEQNSATSSEVVSGENNSVIDTVAGVAKDVIQNTANTLINVIDTVTGSEIDKLGTQDTANQNTTETQLKIDSSNNESFDNSQSPSVENGTGESNVSEQSITE